MKLRVRVPLALAALLALAGCQVTTFELSPLAALPCDPAVAGEWHSVGDEPSGDGEMILRVSADCQLEIEERTPAGPRHGEATPLFLGEHAGQRYAWTDGAWLLRRFGEDHALPAGDVHLVRFAITGDRLELWSTDDKPIAHAIIDGELSGEVIARDRSLFNRLTAPQPPEVLARPGLFDAEPAAFRKVEPRP
ncbi:hypothetical protein [Arenimonas metalli]|uniref:Lipocalin-like domain-containing protein n=1 Tax=Arenimonas metalli CF5-1 TaxID=1384056 RepID=A0A091B0E2_9GAMM|nr:hypothetical protein [Arenimonas metalli]KFN46043.1 hypothetical protein N787_11560 [Arenimonas metalli CF5-1]